MAAGLHRVGLAWLGLAWTFRGLLANKEIFNHTHLGAGEVMASGDGVGPAIERTARGKSLPLNICGVYQPLFFIWGVLFVSEEERQFQDPETKRGRGQNGRNPL